jgi:hypothetical protein
VQSGHSLSISSASGRCVKEARHVLCGWPCISGKHVLILQCLNANLHVLHLLQDLRSGCIRCSPMLSEFSLGFSVFHSPLHSLQCLGWRQCQILQYQFWVCLRQTSSSVSVHHGQGRRCNTGIAAGVRYRKFWELVFALCHRSTLSFYRQGRVGSDKGYVCGGRLEEEIHGRLRLEHIHCSTFVSLFWPCGRKLKSMNIRVSATSCGLRFSSIPSTLSQIFHAIANFKIRNLQGCGFRDLL